MLRTAALIALLQLLLLAPTRALDNGVARTPPMGWNTYNHFGCSPTEDIVLDTAKAIVSSGLKDLGYEYVIIDDCWHADTRDEATGAPREDKTRFPHGMRWLSDQVHALGLKFGIYSDAGTLTCGNRFGSLGYEWIDAQTYAAWGVDYLKYDNCNNEGLSGTPQLSYDRFAAMSVALNATGRPMVYGMCNWGEDQPWNWAGTIAHAWRISGDITDEFKRYDERCPCTSMLDCKLSGTHCTVTRIIDFAAPLISKGGVGRWLDLDMLYVGQGGMTRDEYITHFSFWALFKSPLILGHDVRSQDNATLEIITNSAVIALNQDPWGAQPVRMWRRPVGNGELSLWVLALSSWPTHAIALLNTDEGTHNTTVRFADVFPDSAWLAQRTYRLHDLWARDDAGAWGRDAGVHTGSVDLSVGPHQTRLFRAVSVDHQALALDPLHQAEWLRVQRRRYV